MIRHHRVPGVIGHGRSCRRCESVSSNVFRDGTESANNEEARATERGGAVARGISDKCSCAEARQSVFRATPRVRYAQREIPGTECRAAV